MDQLPATIRPVHWSLHLLCSVAAKLQALMDVGRREEQNRGYAHTLMSTAWKSSFDADAMRLLD